jgi:hypothetical protein
MNEKTAGDQRLIKLIKEGLSSPIEPDDPAFWQKRREALQRAITRKGVKRSS